MIRLQGLQGLTFMVSRVRKKTSKFQGFQGAFQGKEKIQGIFKGFKDRWPSLSKLICNSVHRNYDQSCRMPDSFLSENGIIREEVAIASF